MTEVVDLNFVLFDSPTWDQVVAYWKVDEPWFQEHYHIQAIERYLLTPEQRKRIADYNLTIEKMLNGRYGIAEETMVSGIYKEWNEKLGFYYYFA